MYEEPKGPIETLEEDLEKTIKHWWMFLILGILAIGVGIRLFFTPMQGYAALTVFFALTFLISGLASIFVTIFNRKAIPAWGWNLVSGILMLVLGVILVANLNLSADVLAFYVAFAVMFGGFNTIGYAFTTKSLGDNGWGWNLALGILVVILSIVLLLHPVFTALTITIWTGIAFVSLGVSFCMLAYRLSKTNSLLKK